MIGDIHVISLSFGLNWSINTRKLSHLYNLKMHTKTAHCIWGRGFFELCNCIVNVLISTRVTSMLYWLSIYDETSAEQLPREPLRQLQINDLRYRSSWSFQNCPLYSVFSSVLSMHFIKRNTTDWNYASSHIDPCKRINKQSFEFVALPRGCS